MPYQVGTACYDSAELANAASASSQVGAVRESGSGLVVVNVTAVDATSISYSFQPVAGGSPATATVGISPQPCGLLTWQDGLELGWMVGAVFIGAAVVLFLAKALWGGEQREGPEGYGHT